MQVFEKIEIPQGSIHFHNVEDFVDIINVEIHENFRHQGFGTKLMELFLKQMNKRGNRVITLEVSVNNVAAIALYKKFGFQAVHLRKKYYDDGSDGYLMRLDDERVTEIFE